MWHETIPLSSSLKASLYMAYRTTRGKVYIMNPFGECSSVVVVVVVKASKASYDLVLTGDFTHLGHGEDRAYKNSKCYFLRI